MIANAEARVVKHNKARTRPARPRTDRGSSARSPAGSAPGRQVRLRPAPGRSSRSCAIASAGGRNDYSGITYERLEETGGISWPCPHRGPPRHARGCSRTGGPTTPTARPTSRPSSGTRRPRTRTTTSTRCRSPPAGPSPTSCRATRPAGSAPSSSRPRAPGSRSTRRHGFRQRRPGHACVTRRGSDDFPALVTETIRPDTVFIPYHWPVPGGRQRRSPSTPSTRARKIPEYKVCACRIEHGDRDRRRSPRPRSPPGGHVAYAGDRSVSRTDPRPPTAAAGTVAPSERSEP